MGFSTGFKGQSFGGMKITRTADSIQYILGELPVDVEDPSKGMLPLVINYMRVIPQEGAVDEEDNVVFIGTNMAPNGQSINPLQPAIGFQIESLYDQGGNRRVELHVGEVRPIGGSGPQNRRWLSMQYSPDLDAPNQPGTGGELRGGTAGIWQIFENTRTDVIAQVYGRGFYSGVHGPGGSDWTFATYDDLWAFSGKELSATGTISAGTDSQKLAALIAALDAKGIIIDDT